MIRKNNLWKGEKFSEREEDNGSITRHQKSRYKWPQDNPFY